MRDPVVGDSLDQYLLTDVLARSGMATIFKGLDQKNGQPVALKVPHVQFESDIVFSERFRREEEVGQRLDHPNIVKVLTPLHKGRIYMAMEFVEGTSLRAQMNGKVPFPVERALSIARQLCDALQYLHDQGVVHRDIKPENVILLPGDRVKILDLGIALFASERRLTWAGLSNAIGTPDYMAPEQIRGRRGDPRTDIYAVGTMLYEMLTCNLPYESGNPRAMLRAKTEDEPRSPTYYVPGFDPKLEAIILKAIARDPRDRYVTARQMLEDLTDPSRVAPYDPTTGRARRRGLGAWTRRLALAAGVIVLLVGLGWLVWLTGQHPAEFPNQPPAVPAKGR
jgi:eukaryotic-like serine/threonine-protein kinase